MVLVGILYREDSGLFVALIVSDDYATKSALRAAHQHPGFGMHVRRYPNFKAVPHFNEDEIQEIIDSTRGKPSPPKKRYALVVPGGQVVGVVETRNASDPRLTAHDMHPEFAAIEHAHAAPGDSLIDGTHTKRVPAGGLEGDLMNPPIDADS